MFTAIRVVVIAFLCIPILNAMDATTEASAFFDLKKTPNGFAISFPTNSFPNNPLERTDWETWRLLLMNDIKILESAQQSHIDEWGRLNKDFSLIQKSRRLDRKHYLDSCAPLFKQFISFTNNHPLWLCSECGMAPGESCPLRRQENKEECRRHQFSQTILEIMPNGPEHGVIFYGPGSCTYEIQLSSYFLRNEAKFRNIVLVEPAYDLSYEDMEEFRILMSKSNDNYKINDNNINANHITRIFRLIQISYFFWSYSKEFKIFVYKNHQGLLNDLENRFVPAVDGLVAMDNGDFDINKIKEQLETLEKGLSCGGLVATLLLDQSKKILEEILIKK